MGAYDLAWQASLAPALSPTVDASFYGLRTFALDDSSWVDFVPDWIQGGDSLVDEIAGTAPWQPQRTRVMWDHEVAEPRILARWPDLATLPAPVEEMRLVLSNRYRTDFDLVGVNLYRDGRDSVAWHGDRVRLTHLNPIVVTVSLGERRPFLMRRRGGGPSVLSLQLGGGDLLVMAGACQHDWEHCVPKRARAGARMSITFRHSGEAGAFRGTRSGPSTE